MKVVILAGGLGTRISEESHLRPKPMIEIGDYPILWHIMKIYAAQGFNEFVLCLGYKGQMVKEYFLNYHYYNSDLTVDLARGGFEVHRKRMDPMKVTLVDTGQDTFTAGRLKRVERYLNGEPFMLTYGDGLADIDLGKLMEFHRAHGRTATVTAVQPAGRFGMLNLRNSGEVYHFQEKPPGDGGWTNGGFFIFEPDVFDYLPENADRMMLEGYLMTQLSNAGNLFAYHHHGFWKCMDALRDKMELEELWRSPSPPWKIW